MNQEPVKWRCVKCGAINHSDLRQLVNGPVQCIGCADHYHVNVLANVVSIEPAQGGQK